MKQFLMLSLALYVCTIVLAQSAMPLRGLAIAAPTNKEVASFVKFIHEELSPRQINTLVLRVDYNFQYTSHPELVTEGALSRADVTKIMEACRQHGISIIPQINMLGHQSWEGWLGKLLEVYPEFDETPGIKMPGKNYSWPNADSLYCKSYCPLHPGVHKVVFALVDEIVAAFQATAFHAGLDEVFYIGHPGCSRCSRLNKASLFAGEVTLVRNHLAEKNVKMWMWGDRLLDGASTGIGMWEASMNNTYQAIDNIPKDIIICDWHYERVESTAPYFAVKGFDVATSSWQNTKVALEQQSLMARLRQDASTTLQNRYKGMLHTVWSSASDFFQRYYNSKEGKKTDDADCFKALFPRKTGF